MDCQTINNTQDMLQCEGINITLHFFPSGQTLQKCIAELLRIHMEK